MAVAALMLGAGCFAGGTTINARIVSVSTLANGGSYRAAGASTDTIVNVGLEQS